MADVIEKSLVHHSLGIHVFMPMLMLLQLDDSQIDEIQVGVTHE